MRQQIMDYIRAAREKQHPVCVWGAGYVGTGYGYALLKELNITVDYYCDNNTELYGKIIIDNIYCIEKEKIPKDSIIFVLVAGHLVFDVCKQLTENGFEKIVSYQNLCELRSKDYFLFQNKKQIVIYTCITGDYDEIQCTGPFAEDCDYYVITDSKPEKRNCIDNVVYLDIGQMVPPDITDNTRRNRYCKINAYKLFPQYRYSIYFDGNFEVKKELTRYIKTLPKTRITALCRTGYDSIYAEALRCIKHGRDDEELLTKQVEKYWLEGMPDDFGLVGPGLLIREHNHPVCRKIMQDWWQEVDTYSKRDMISLSYVLWKNGFGIEDVTTLTSQRDCVDGDDWILHRNHKTGRIKTV